MSELKQTTIEEIFDDLDAGLFGKRLAAAIRDAALGTVATGDKKKRGKVTVVFEIGQVGESNQVQVDHTIEYRKPTHRGSVSEVHTTSTALYVGTMGNLTVLPNSNRELDFASRPEREEQH